MSILGYKNQFESLLNQAKVAAKTQLENGFTNGILALENGPGVTNKFRYGSGNPDGGEFSAKFGALKTKIQDKIEFLKDTPLQFITFKPKVSSSVISLERIGDVVTGQLPINTFAGSVASDLTLDVGLSLPFDTGTGASGSISITAEGIDNNRITGARVAGALNFLEDHDAVFQGKITNSFYYPINPSSGAPSEQKVWSWNVWWELFRY